MKTPPRNASLSWCESVQETFSGLARCVLCAQSLNLCNPVDCSPPGSSVHGIFQARILEWVAISSSRGSSQPRDQTWVSCIAGRFFTREKEVNRYCLRLKKKYKNKHIM